MIKSKNTYGQLLHKVFNQEMKHGCELVITGLAAMQGCSYLHRQSSRKTKLSISLYRIFKCYEKYPAFIEFLFSKSPQI